MSANKNRRLAGRFKLPENAVRTGRVSTGYLKGERQIRHAEIYDISQGGISFRISANYAPVLGELIAIEFQLPKSGRMAWYAKVVRMEFEFIETRADVYTQVLRIAATFIEMPEFRQKQLGRLIESVSSQILNVKPNERASILTEALTVRRRYDVTVWRFVRPILLIAISLFLGFEFLTYLSTVGSRYMRGSGPPIWADKNHAPFEDVADPIAPDSK